ADRVQSLTDDEEQDERQGDERNQNRGGAKCHEERRHQLACSRSRHHAASAVAGSATTICFVLRAMLQINSRDRRFTTSVMMKSTRPISTSAWRYSSSAASANSFAMTAAIVYCGANNDSDTFGLFPITIVTAIVSPSARPNPSIMAPTIPVRA